MISSGSEWIDVTAEFPCQACGKPDWCTRSGDGSAFICRRTGTSPHHGEGSSRQQGDGQTYWLFSEGKGFVSGQHSSDPDCTYQIAETRADPDTLNRVYQSLIDRIPLHIATRKELERRGLNWNDRSLLQSQGYRWLPSKGRSAVAKKVLRDCGEAAMATTPGFVVREHDGRKYWTISGHEGLLIPIRDSQGRIVAIKIRSVREVAKRYFYLSSKKAGGSSPGSPVHVPKYSLPAETVRVTEGPLKADVATLKSKMLTIALPGIGSWRKASRILHEVGAQTVHVAFDSDWRTNAAVWTALNEFIQSLQGEGFRVVFEYWESAAGKGIDDVLIAGNPVEQTDDPDEIQRLLADVNPEGTESHVSGCKAGKRAAILVSPDEHIVVDQTLQALKCDANLYYRSGQLVHVIHEPVDSDEHGISRSTGTPRILCMSSGHLRERMAERCYFFKPSEGGESQCSPPASVVNAIHTRGFWPQLRHLSGVTEIPVLRPDGSVLADPGWDEATGLLFSPQDGIVDIPENPTKGDALSAKERLLDLVADFPFATPAHQSAWLAGLLTILSRRAFAGPAPMFLIDANIRGSGKSMLTDVISLIATNRPMPRLSNPESDDETRKRITALALAGDPMVLIDNISGTLGSASLDAVLTSTAWKDRRLGGNDIVEMPMRAVWFATGNNVVLTGDMSRRVCHVRLDSLEENPEERSGFRHPKLLAYVRENREQLLAAGLTILRAYVVAGRPDAGLSPWGSFEGWSDLIRNCLVWVGMDDPGRTRKELTEASDRDAGALRLLFDCWDDIDPKAEGLSASDMITLLDFNRRQRDYIDGGMPISDAKRLIEEERQQMETAKTALCELCGVADLTSREVRKIGYQLRRFKGRVIGNRRLECRTYGRNKVNRWQVVDVNAGDAVHAVHVFPRHKILNEIYNYNSVNNSKQCETYTASPASPAFQDVASVGPDVSVAELCPNCHFEPGEDCPNCY